MKKLIVIVLLVTIYNGVNAQRQSTTAKAVNKFSIGLEAGIPVGEFSKIYSHTIGGSLQYEMMPSSDLGITVNGGYLRYQRKSDYGSGGSGFVPVMAGVKYYFVPGVFFHAQLGAAVGTAKGQGTSFAYTPGLGINLSPNFDITLKYMGISNSGGNLDNAGLRIAYNF